MKSLRRRRMGLGRRPVRLKSGVAIAVIGRLFFGVLQDVVGFVDFLELAFSIRIIRIAVRVKFLGLRPVSFFDVRVRRGL